MRIAVIDDEPELCTLISDLLRAEGHEVLTFDDPHSATKLRAANSDLDLFLIDIMLPGMDGISVARYLDEAGFDETPKVAISASRARLQTAYATELFSDTLVKPFDIEQLFGCIERCTLDDRQVASA